jgi:hypothetical protein
VKRVLVGHPEGPRLYELTDAEYARLDHLMASVEPLARAAWVMRFLGERTPAVVFPPGSRGLPDGIAIDRAIGGNMFTPKWGRNQPLDD